MLAKIDKKRLMKNTMICLALYTQITQFMSEELVKITTEAEAGMKKAINHLEIEISKIRAGKASPSILEGINVDYYGTPTPISQVANVQVLDTRTISIQPWEKNMLALIERSIMAANIGWEKPSTYLMCKIFKYH